MITSKEEYLSKLADIQLMRDGNYFRPIPESEKIYKIDLNSRTIEAPRMLSVVNDHEAEIIYFEVDRFFDFQDLYQTTCLIVYNNAAGEHYIYNVPCMDAVTKRNENKILIPWFINQNATYKKGTIKFAFKFYIIDPLSLEFKYVLNTQPATTQVVEGLEPSYTEANATAAADYTAGKWPEVYQNYFVKNSKNRFEHASQNYQTTETYYLLTEESRISDGTRLEVIFQEAQKLSREGVKWVEL